MIAANHAWAEAAVRRRRAWIVRLPLPLVAQERLIRAAHGPYAVGARCVLAMIGLGVLLVLAHLVTRRPKALG